MANGMKFRGGYGPSSFGTRAIKNTARTQLWKGICVPGEGELKKRKGFERSESGAERQAGGGVKSQVVRSVGRCGVSRASGVTRAAGGLRCKTQTPRARIHASQTRPHTPTRTRATTHARAGAYDHARHAHARANPPTRRHSPTSGDRSHCQYQTNQLHSGEEKNQR